MTTSADRGSNRSRLAQAHHSGWLDVAARSGLVSFGVVHLLLGWLAVSLGFGDRSGSTSTTGAVRELAQQPFGGVLVWLVAIGMTLLVLWQALEAISGHRDADADSAGSTGSAGRDGFLAEHRRTRKRLTSAGKAVVYAVIGWSALQVATGSGASNSEKSTDSMTSRLMDLPAGPALVFAVGLGVAAVGVGLLVTAWRETYLDRVDAAGRRGTRGTVLRALGRAGHVAKAVALGGVAVLFCYASVSHDPDRSGGIDQALQRVLREPFGPVAVIAVGLGFGAYGLFCLLQARHLSR